MAASVADALIRCRRDIAAFVRRGDRWTLAEAAAVLVLMRVGLWVLPFGTLQRTIARAAPREHRARGAAAAAIGRSVAAVARRLPLMTCLVEALAAQAMLRRRGCESTLKFGVRPGGTGRAIDAHAWLVCDGLVVVGDFDGGREYATLERAARG